MANHGEVAKVVYASALGRTSASRIWRTVVVAGAMIGAPMAASAEAPKAPVAKPAVTSVAEPARSPLDPPPVQTKAERAAELKEALLAVEAELKALDAQREELKKKHAATKAAWRKADAEAKAEARPRPRVEKTKPMGRGFILS